ncbi:MAG: hypothetical protein ACRYGK_11440, partial [Janthinobacterium lividum]
DICQGLDGDACQCTGIDNPKSGSFSACAYRCAKVCNDIDLAKMFWFSHEWLAILNSWIAELYEVFDTESKIFCYRRIIHDHCIENTLYSAMLESKEST